jgi:Fur family peroxide stress response transcriptional regulator
MSTGGDLMNIASHLENHGIKPFINRILIYENIINKDHPTADDIFRGAREKNPNLSKMTVYNILNLFLDAGIIREVTINEKQSSYDVKTLDHGHFKCSECGNIWDFRVDMESIDIDMPDAAEISKKDLFFFGICKQCRRNEDNT